MMHQTHIMQEPPPQNHMVLPNGQMIGVAHDPFYHHQIRSDPHEEKEQRLNQKESALNSKDRQLDERKSELESKASRLDRRERELSEKEDALNSKASRLDRKERELSTKEDSLNRKASQLKSKEEDLERKISEFEARMKPKPPLDNESVVLPAGKPFGGAASVPVVIPGGTPFGAEKKEVPHSAVVFRKWESHKHKIVMMMWSNWIMVNFCMVFRKRNKEAFFFFFFCVQNFRIFWLIFVFKIQFVKQKKKSFFFCICTKIQISILIY